MVVQRLLFLLITALTLGVQDTGASTFYVNGDPDIGDDRRSVVSGQSAATPFRTITQALAVAHIVSEGRPHIIVLEPGTYRHGVNGEQFPLVITEPDIFIQPGGGEVTFDGDGAHKFFELSNLGDEFLLQGFDFFNGLGDRGTIASCEACSLRVTDNRFRFNSATDSGHLLYVKDGRLRFFNNIVSENGMFPGEDVPLIELANEFDDTSDPDQRDFIRNNTFFDNDGPTILSSGNGLDLSSNIFQEGVEAVVVDQSATADPVFRYNIFWDSDILFVDEEMDSIKVERTVRDTIVKEQPGIPSFELVYTIPDFVLFEPDTLIIFTEGETTSEVHDYFIDVGDFRDFWEFKALSVPEGVDPSVVVDEGRVTWAPTIADTGRYQIEVEIKDPSKIDNLLTYPLRVVTVWPPLELPPIPPIIDFSFVADTTGAINGLNALTPAFGTAASAGSNLYADPLLISPEPPFRNFILNGGSPGIHGGDPTVLFDDVNKTPNDVGFQGGPTNGGGPNSGTFAEIEITTLPDTVAKAGETYTYPLETDPVVTIQRVDILQGPPTMAAAFGTLPPIDWVPTDADAGTFLVGVIVTVTNDEGRQFFNLRVKPENELPFILSDPDVEALEDEDYSYTVLASDPDEDAFSFNLLSGPEGLALDASGVVTWAPGQANVGDNEVQIEVLDARGGSTIHLYTLSVINVNDQPAFTSTPLLSATEDVLYSYAAEASDPDPGDNLTFSLLAAPAGAVVDGEGLLQWTPLQADVGSNAIQLQVADAEGSKATQSFAIEVTQVDDPPLISSAPVTVVNEDDLYAYSLLATDEEGGGVDFALTEAPTGMSVDPLGIISWTPLEADVGIHTVTVSVTDSSALESLQSFELEVIAVDDAPTIDGRTPAEALILGTAGSSQTLSVTASDEEGDELSYSWFVDGVVQPSSTAATFSHTIGADMAATIEVKVSDGSTSTSSLWVVDGRVIPRFSISGDDEVDFGAVDLGDESAIVLDISNNGQQVLEISNLQLPDLQFAASFGTATLAAGSSTTLEVRFVPTSRGLQQTLLSFTTTDPDNAQIQIPLAAEVIVPSRFSIDADPASGNQSTVDVIAGAGQQVAIALYLTEALVLKEYGVSLQFDAASLAFDEFQQASSSEANLIAAAGGSLTTSVSAPSQGVVDIEVSEGSAFAGVDGDGLLGVLLFSVASDVAPGAETEVILASATLLSADQSEADALSPMLTVNITIPVLVGDFDGNNAVDFTDFFKFADNFGSAEPLYDLDNSGLVDLDDFFEFADNFGASISKSVATLQAEHAEQAPEEFLSLQADVQRPSELSVIVITASGWQSQADGFAIEMEYDPSQLRFAGFESSDSDPIVWTPANGEGKLILAVARVGDFDAGALGQLQFDRLSPGETSIRLLNSFAWADGELRRFSTSETMRIESLPTQLVLYPVYPNPSNPETTVAFFLPEQTVVSLRIFNLLGQQVRHLLKEGLSPGYHRIQWDGRDEAGLGAASGVYLVEIRAGDLVRVSKMVLVQ